MIGPNVPCVVLVNVLADDIVVNEFQIQSFTPGVIKLG